MKEELLNEFSNILKDKDIDINELIDKLNDKTTSNKKETDYKENENNKNNNSNNNSYNSSNINFSDIQNILKMKEIFDKSNTQNSKNLELLSALKPFMKDSRKEKIDKYSKMLRFAEIAKTLDLFGGDKN